MSQNEWITPWEEFYKWERRFHFTVDACATKYNNKVTRFWSPEEDGLLQDWSGERVWFNPPYSADQLYKWVYKAHEHRAEVAVGLLPSNTGTGWFHDCIWDAENRQEREGVEMHLRRGRIAFVHPTEVKNSPRYDNLIAVFWRL